MSYCYVVAVSESLNIKNNLTKQDNYRQTCNMKTKRSYKHLKSFNFRAFKSVHNDETNNAPYL